MDSVKHSYIIKYHDAIVEYGLIPKGTQKVINIDFHNDIVAQAEDDLNEGTWGNFMPKCVKKFEWRYPSYTDCIRSGSGICNPGGKAKDYPVRYSRKLGIEGISLTSLNSVVICLSPNWDYAKVLPDFVSMLGVCPLSEVEDYIMSLRSYRSIPHGR